MYGRHSRPVEHVRRVLCAVRVIYGGKARFLRLDPGDTPSAPSAQARALRARSVFRTVRPGRFSLCSVLVAAVLGTRKACLGYGPPRSGVLWSGGTRDGRNGGPATFCTAALLDPFPLPGWVFRIAPLAVPG